jgi:hypothetical protein
VPQLIAFLRDRRSTPRYPANWDAHHAARELGKFGPVARMAVPELIDAYYGRSNSIHKAAREALKAIDPEAAAKAGIK